MDVKIGCSSEEAAAAALAGPVAAAVVGACRAAYGLYDAIDNGVELLGKIAADLAPIIVDEGLLPAGEAATNLFAAIADGILASYRVGKEPPPTIGPHDFVYVIDDEDDRFPDAIEGTDAGEIFFGRNGAIIDGAGGDDEIHQNGSGEARGGECDPQLLLSGNVCIVADGGAGDDWILSRDGSGGAFIGGNARLDLREDARRRVLRRYDRRAQPVRVGSRGAGRSEAGRSGCRRRVETLGSRLRHPAVLGRAACRRRPPEPSKTADVVEEGSSASGSYDAASITDHRRNEIYRSGALPRASRERLRGPRDRQPRRTGAR